MAMQTWWLYVTAVFLIAATPGPNELNGRPLPIVTSRARTSRR